MATNDERIARLRHVASTNMVIVEMRRELDLLYALDTLAGALESFLALSVTPPHLETQRQRWLASAEKSRLGVEHRITELEQWAARDLEPVTEARH